MRQAGRAAEEGEHERDEVELAGEGGAADAFEIAAGEQQLIAAEILVHLHPAGIRDQLRVFCRCVPVVSNEIRIREAIQKNIRQSLNTQSLAGFGR